MNPEDLARILDDLGERLGPAGEYAFSLAVRQVFIDGAMGLVVGLVGVVVIAAVFAVAIRATRREWHRQLADRDSYHRPDFMMDIAFPWFLGGFLLLLPFGFCLTLLMSAIPKLLNPEYAALADILSRITGS